MDAVGGADRVGAGPVQRAVGGEKVRGVRAEGRLSGAAGGAGIAKVRAVGRSCLEWLRGDNAPAHGRDHPRAASEVYPQRHSRAHGARAGRGGGSGASGGDLWVGYFGVSGEDAVLLLSADTRARAGGGGGGFGVGWNLTGAAGGVGRAGGVGGIVVRT